MRGNEAAGNRLMPARLFTVALILGIEAFTFSLNVRFSQAKANPEKRS